NHQPRNRLDRQGRTIMNLLAAPAPRPRALSASHNPVTINLAETAPSRCARLVDDTVHDETPQVKAVPDPRARDNDSRHQRILLIACPGSLRMYRRNVTPSPGS